MSDAVEPAVIPGGLTAEELAAAKAYMRAPEGDDAFVASCVIAARAYLEGAGVSLPRVGTLRRELYDMVVHAYALTMYDHRDLLVANALSANPFLVSLKNQLKFTEDNFPADGGEVDEDEN